jgi:hypothetical protein
VFYELCREHMFAARQSNLPSRASSSTRFCAVQHAPGGSKQADLSQGTGVDYRQRKKEQEVRLPTGNSVCFRPAIAALHCGQSASGRKLRSTDMGPMLAVYPTCAYVSALPGANRSGCSLTGPVNQA